VFKLVPQDVAIPERPKEWISRWAKRIRPVMVHKDGLWTTKPCDLFDVAFSWDPKPDEEMPRTAKVWRKIHTLHTYGYHGFFKPSIAEVIAQIPEEDLLRVRWFSVEGPDDAADLNMFHDVVNAGFHVAKTTLYHDEKEFMEWLDSHPDPEERAAFDARLRGEIGRGE
jgi:hypothetical protein